MKRWTTLLIVICMLGITIPAMGAMSISKMRQNTRFLTENILLFQYVRTIQVIVCHRAQSRCSLKFGISVQICNVYV